MRGTRLQYKPIHHPRSETRAITPCSSICGRTCGLVDHAPSPVSRIQLASNRIFNPNCGYFRMIVLPAPHHDPSGVDEQRVCFRVPLKGALDLSRPEVRVCPGDRVVLRAAMPEATIQEHRHLRRREHHVRGSSYLLDGSAVDEKAQPTGMDSSTERELGTRVPSAVGAHARANPGRRCPRPLPGHAIDSSGEPVSATGIRNLR